jgi:hypothetical protein
MSFNLACTITTLDGSFFGLTGTMPVFIHTITIK